MNKNPRTLEFWQGKLNAVKDRFADLHSRERSNYIQFKNWIKPFKLKKQHGHGLNNEYTGYKIHSRRKAWLKSRLTKLTIMAKCKSEMARLKRTKLPFYIQKVESLGGKVDKADFWLFGIT